MARPSKLTPTLQKDIIARLSAGSTIKATCDSVGITDQTYRNWINRGEAESKRRENPNVKEGTQVWQDEDPYFVFFWEATRAQADGMIQAAIRFREGMNPSESEAVTTETTIETRLRKVKKDGVIVEEPYEYKKTVTRKTVTHNPGDWRAAMEYLARRDPENWARQAVQRTEHTGAEGGAMKVEFVYPKDADGHD